MNVSLNNPTLEPLERGGKQVVGAASGSTIGDYQEVVCSETHGMADGSALIQGFDGLAMA
jgi:hypothetical protein